MEQTGICFGDAGCVVTIGHIATNTEHPPSTLPPDDERLSRPLFTLREAAGYLGMPLSTLHAWGRSPDPLITVGPRQGQQASVPFIGFAEAFVLSAFRRAGVPLQRIRPAVEVLRDTMRIDHALAAEHLYTDGAEVLFDYAHEHGETDLLELTVVRTGQKQFSELVRGYLKRIRYADDGWASMLELPSYRYAKVVVDPRRAFGLPLLVHGGARVEDIVDRFVAGDHLADIAYDFAVPEHEVEDVIRVATRAAPAA